MSNDDWRPWMGDPPYYSGYKVIEWKRTGDDGEPNVDRLADLIHPRNSHWNVADLLWRPVS